MTDTLQSLTVRRHGEEWVVGAKIEHGASEEVGRRAKRRE